MRLAKEIRVQILTTKSDSQLVTCQVNGEYQARDPQLVKYWDMAKKLVASFESFTLLPMPTNVCSVGHSASWKDPITTFLRIEETPNNPLVAKKLIREAAKYTLISQQLYRRGFRVLQLVICFWFFLDEYLVMEGSCMKWYSEKKNVLDFHLVSKYVVM
ncbi:hypothetical protein CR513_32212, partial [Mucuna pruriens]